MADETYNGWSNRETWAINLHLSNNEGDYNQMTEKAREIVEAQRELTADDAEFDRDSCVWEMAEYIKEWTETVFDSVINPESSEIGPGGELARLFVSDVGSYWRADFDEMAGDFYASDDIAKHWIDEAMEGSE